jgi:hypothetical protein
MICYWSERCMLRPSLWFVTGQNAVCYDQVDDLLLVRTLNGMTKFMICYFSERHILWYVIFTYKLTAVFKLYSTTFMICYWTKRCMLRRILWFVTGQNAVCCDQVYDLLLVRTLYVTTKLMICYWFENTMLLPNLWFVTGQNTVW